MADIDLQSLLQRSPTSMDDILDALTPAIYENLKQAIELGRWQDASRLSTEQLEHAMQLVILYEARHLPEQDRTGSPLKDNCKSKAEDSHAIEVLDINQETMQ